jgi:hypothetical protein
MSHNLPPHNIIKELLSTRDTGITQRYSEGEALFRHKTQGSGFLLYTFNDLPGPVHAITAHNCSHIYPYQAGYFFIILTTALPPHHWRSCRRMTQAPSLQAYSDSDQSVDVSRRLKAVRFLSPWLKPPLHCWPWHLVGIRDSDLGLIDWKEKSSLHKGISVLTDRWRRHSKHLFIPIVLILQGKYVVSA